MERNPYESPAEESVEGIVQTNSAQKWARFWIYTQVASLVLAYFLVSSDLRASLLPQQLWDALSLVAIGSMYACPLAMFVCVQRASMKAWRRFVLVSLGVAIAGVQLYVLLPSVQ